MESGHPALFASLRASQEEQVLVLINLGAQAISDYALQLEASPLSGDYLPAPLLGNGQFQSITVTAQGGFENYQPLPEIPPYGRFILQLQPQTK